MASADPDELWANLEQLGEKEVRRKVLLNAYGPNKRPAVQAWLQSKEAERAQDRDSKDQAQRSDELGILRSTKNAAWVAAVAALLSMISAAIAVWRSKT